MTQKLSFRFYNDREIRAVWDETARQWLFSVADIVGAVSGSADAHNYWYVLKSRLKKAGMKPLASRHRLWRSKWRSK